MKIKLTLIAICLGANIFAQDSSPTPTPTPSPTPFDVLGIAGTPTPTPSPTEEDTDAALEKWHSKMVNALRVQRANIVLGYLSLNNQFVDSVEDGVSLTASQKVSYLSSDETVEISTILWQLYNGSTGIGPTLVGAPAQSGTGGIVIPVPSLTAVSGS